MPTLSPNWSSGAPSNTWRVLRETGQRIGEYQPDLQPNRHPTGMHRSPRPELSPLARVGKILGQSIGPIDNRPRRHPPEPKAFVALAVVAQLVHPIGLADHRVRDV